MQAVYIVGLYTSTEAQDTYWKEKNTVKRTDHIDKCKSKSGLSMKQWSKRIFKLRTHARTRARTHALSLSNTHTPDFCVWKKYISEHCRYPQLFLLSSCLKEFGPTVVLHQYDDSFRNKQEWWSFIFNFHPWLPFQIFSKNLADSYRNLFGN